MGSVLSHPLPIHATPRSNDDRRGVAERRRARVVAQAAVVRSMLDHVERFAQANDADGPRVQLVHEMVQLAWRLLEAAAAMTRPGSPEGSGGGT
jgi:hypothetical protein